MPASRSSNTIMISVSMRCCRQVSQSIRIPPLSAVPRLTNPSVAAPDMPGRYLPERHPARSSSTLMLGHSLELLLYYALHHGLPVGSYVSVPGCLPDREDHSILCVCYAIVPHPRPPVPVKQRG